MRTLPRLAAAAVALPLGALACGALLGIDDVSYGGADATADGALDASPRDGTAGDALASDAPLSDAPAGEGGAPCVLNGCVDFATGQDNPTAILATTKTVYWTNETASGVVATCPVDGCDAGDGGSRFADVTPSPNGLAAGNLFGGPPVLFVSSATGATVALDVADGGVFGEWTATGTTRDPVQVGGHLFLTVGAGPYAPVSACTNPSFIGCTNGVQVIPTADGDSGAGLHMAIGANLWFTTRDGVWWHPATLSAASATLFTATSRANAVAVEGSDQTVYWSVDGPDGGVYGAPTSGADAGAPTLLVGHRPGTIAAMVVEGAKLYFADRDEGRIYRVDRSMKDRIDVIIDGLGNAQGLAVNDRFVFATSSSGRIVRANKPR